MDITIPSLEEMWTRIQDAFGVRPCDFQIQDTIAQLQQKDVVTISPTGSGKSLTFWTPLLFMKKGIIIIITALNILGEQNVNDLAKLGISAVNVTAENANDNLFKVSN
jgi:superfamily II DNA helicase RecQ